MSEPEEFDDLGIVDKPNASSSVAGEMIEPDLQKLHEITQDPNYESDILE